jgi:GH24 family phage-related lysozyme (muramidase)
MREIGDKGIDLILGFEKDVLEVYDDGFGYPTAGVGHRLSPAELAAMPIGTHITRKQSREWFRA